MRRYDWKMSDAVIWDQHYSSNACLSYLITTTQFARHQLLQWRYHFIHIGLFTTNWKTDELKLQKLPFNGASFTSTRRSFTMLHPTIWAWTWASPSVRTLFSIILEVHYQQEAIRIRPTHKASLQLKAAPKSIFFSGRKAAFTKKFHFRRHIYTCNISESLNSIIYIVPLQNSPLKPTRLKLFTYILKIKLINGSDITTQPSSWLVKFRLKLQNQNKTSLLCGVVLCALHSLSIKIEKIFQQCVM